LDLINESSHFKDVELFNDYMLHPQPAGYRAIHLKARVGYDGIDIVDGLARVKTDYRLYEIQIRTKLQDSWADTTHEFFYKAKNDGVRDEHYEEALQNLRYCAGARNAGVFEDDLLSMRPERPPKTSP
jgi:putative GTP pyrophosphokinase